jgi:alpha-N-arabinofuranosidase
MEGDDVRHRAEPTVSEREPVASHERTSAMRKVGIAGACLVVLTTNLQAAELHVAKEGNDSSPGTRAAPLGTIQRAAELARPGDVITVHEGVYRERVNPPRGGESDGRRIVYQAAPGEKVEIRGSEVVKGWTRVENDAWKATVSNSLFGDFNPYSDVIHGDWFDPKGRVHHTGAVYLDGEWLIEAAALDEVLAPTGKRPAWLHGGGEPEALKAGLWFARVERESTTIWAQFPGVDPNARLVEINARRAVFYPDRPGRDYITVRGFALRHAATPWAPPTAEQVGLISPHWSKGWIIEGNTISHAICSGVSLGKYGNRWDNTSADTAEGYVKTIERALSDGWSKETVGHHVVRDNDISHCEQAGVVGSLGAAFSTVEGNTIHDVHVRRLFGGAEMAGIKLHAAIDVQIRRNTIRRACLGLWLDWMAQGTRVTANLFHANGMDLFVEVDHGPFLVDNNLFLSPATLLNYSQGGAFAHNLMMGTIHINSYDARLTPFHRPHSTAVAGLHDNPNGDDRYFNNVLVGPVDLSQYDHARLPVRMEGNVFLRGAKPSAHEAKPVVLPDFDPSIRLIESSDGIDLEAAFPSEAATARMRPLVSTALLGKAAIPGASYEAPDGSPIALDVDFLGKHRNRSNPVPGPLEDVSGGRKVIRIRSIVAGQGRGPR